MKLPPHLGCRHDGRATCPGHSVIKPLSSELLDLRKYFSLLVKYAVEVLASSNRIK